MNADNVMVQIEPGSKKRAMMPNELFGKFSAKSDFIKYFWDSL